MEAGIGFAELGIGAALIAGASVGMTGAGEAIAGIFFVPESLGFTILVTILGFFELAVGVGAVAIGSMLIVDGFSRIFRGQSIFGPRGLDTPLGKISG